MFLMFTWWQSLVPITRCRINMFDLAAQSLHYKLYRSDTDCPNQGTAGVEQMVGSELL